jgi:hypothetical protein
VGTAWWQAGYGGDRWQAPFPIAPPHAARPGAIAALSRTKDHVDVFWIGPDGGVGTNWWHTGVNGDKWNTPFPIAPPNAARPGALAAVARTPDHARFSASTGILAQRDRQGPDAR